MWTYQQNTGNLLHDDHPFAIGYSGREAGLNNPALENVRNLGPIPCGLWRLGVPVEHTHLGPYAIPLTPVNGTNTFGRTAFFIHSDRMDCGLHPHLASEGCIILPYHTRQAMVESGEELEVVTGLVDSGA